MLKVLLLDKGWISVIGSVFVGILIRLVMGDKILVIIFSVLLVLNILIVIKIVIIKGIILIVILNLDFVFLVIVL